jgi:CDP-4-dehydro-6-deoxyglucose reductase
MEVREHLSQHETVRTLPLITESATVTAVEPMDRSRNSEVIRTIRATLEEYGNEAWQRERPEGKTAQRRLIRDKLDRVDRGAPLNEYLGESVRRSAVGGELRSLQERYIRPYPSLVRIAVETDESVEFVAGQYLSIRYRGTTRVYSLASSPNREELEFCIRRVPGGRLTPTLSADLEPGEEVTLRGPYGDFVMEPPSKRDLVFLATGTGVAPFKSMLDFCFEEGRETHRGETRDVWLFLGCAWVDDLPYREAFRALERDHEAFHFVPTLSRERCLSPWEGETAYVQHVLGKYVTEEAFAGVELPRGFERARREPPREDVDARIDPGNVEVYACGINAMVYGLVDAVERLGVPDRHTQFEGFG